MARISNQMGPWSMGGDSGGCTWPTNSGGREGGSELR
jgi:hypothetical protein